MLCVTQGAGFPFSKAFESAGTLSVHCAGTSSIYTALLAKINCNKYISAEQEKEQGNG